jgi:hypothetical protein
MQAIIGRNQNTHFDMEFHTMGTAIETTVTPWALPSKKRTAIETGIGSDGHILNHTPI